MDPAQKKWLNSLITHISSNFLLSVQDNAPLLRFNISYKEFLYKLIHTTGLIFGFPGSSIFKKHPLENEWNEIDKAKVYFTESLVAVYLFHHKENINIRSGQEKIKSILLEAIEEIYQFYLVYSPIKKQRFNLLDYVSKKFSKDNSTISKLEQILDQRLKPSKITSSKYWHGSLYNVFIYLDIIYFAEWIKDKNKNFHKKDEIIQLEIIKVIVLSIQNTTNNDKELEESFFNFFLENTSRSTRLKKLDILNTWHISFDSFSLKQSFPEIIRTILFEYGIFVVLLDKNIDQSESTYIDILAEKFGINSDEKEVYNLVVSSFIFKNLNNVSYLKNRNVVDIVSSNIYRKLTSVIIKNKGKISREINESKELAELIWKSKNTDLTDEEKEKVKQQLTDIFLRTIPSLAIFMIPGGSILLPIILKILPDEILIPSSFRNK